MDLKTTIQNDMKTAMKAGETDKVGTLRMLISEIKKREIDKRSALDEGEIQKALTSMVKQRNDSVEAFIKGNRPDLADKEKAEITVLQTYMPKQMSAAEIDALVTSVIAEVGAAGPNDIGKVMKALSAKAAGKADGKTLNEVARAKLNKA